MGVCEGLGDGGSVDARVGVGLPPPTGMSWRAAVFAMGVAVDDKDGGDGCRVRCIWRVVSVDAIWLGIRGYGRKEVVLVQSS